MIVDANNQSTDIWHCRIIDLDTGEEIHRTLPIVYADDDLGIYEILVLDRNGLLVPDPENPQQTLKERRRGRIKIIVPAPVG